MVFLGHGVFPVPRLSPPCLPEVGLGSCLELKKHSGWIDRWIQLTITKKKEKGGLQSEYEWAAIDLVPEKRDVEFEDYEKILQRAFRERLSVKR